MKSSSRRAMVLMAVLLVLVAYYLFDQGSLRAMWPQRHLHPLPGKPEVSGVTVRATGDSRWLVDFDYFWPGETGEASLHLRQSEAPAGVAEKRSAWIGHAGMVAGERGRHHAQIELRRPADDDYRHTREITVTLEVGNPHVGVQTLASQKIAADIEWPTQYMLQVAEAAKSGPPDKVVEQQALRIDSGDPAQLRQAKDVLELLVRTAPQTDTAYLELARLAMKLNWGPEGLAQAERLLDSARQIRPDNANTKILQGYVYAHQKRYKEAEVLFADAGREPTRNLWLWFNWGELFDMQGNTAAAAQKYQRAVDEPPSDATYDIARRYAFARLIAITEDNGDFARAESLHKQRIADYGDSSCFGLAYAQFLLYARLDAASALARLRKLADVRCSGIDVNETMGVASYVLWAAAKEPERAGLLRQARVQMPAGPRLFLRLAGSDRTLGTARALVAAGERVDQIDNQQFTALGYALQARDLATARRLIGLGARPDAPVGAESVPAAFIPVVNRDLEGIKLMQRAGVNYATLKFRDFTALDHARQLQDRELLEALDPQGKSL